MSAEMGLVREYRVGRYTVEMSSAIPNAGEVTHGICAWSPRVPKSLTSAEREQYAAAHEDFLAELTRRAALRGPILSVDLAP